MEIEKRIDLKDIPYQEVYETFVLPTLDGRRVNILWEWDKLRRKYEVSWYKPYNPCSEINLPTKQGVESMTEDNVDREFVEVEVTSKVNLPSIAGYRYTGEHRQPELGEFFLVRGEVGGPLPYAALKYSHRYPRFILERVRWRASHGEQYYYVTDYGHVGQESELRLRRSNLRYSVGNYYRTKQEAVDAADKFQELFKQ